MTRESGPVLVAIDSMTLVWGVKKEGTSDQLQRAKWLFEQLETDKAQIILPAVALSEYLTPIDPREHTRAITALKERFLIPPFDVECASLAARLFWKGKELREVDEQMSQPGARKCLRADALIIATAVRHGARILYTGDDKCRRLASTIKHLEVKDLPEMPDSLFGYEDRGV